MSPWPAAVNSIANIIFLAPLLFLVPVSIIFSMSLFFYQTFFSSFTFLPLCHLYFSPFFTFLLYFSLPSTCCLPFFSLPFLPALSSLPLCPFADIDDYLSSRTSFSVPLCLFLYFVVISVLCFLSLCECIFLLFLSVMFTKGSPFYAQSQSIKWRKIRSNLYISFHFVFRFSIFPCFPHIFYVDSHL